MKEYLLALDEGTTSVRAILFHKTGKVISVAQHEFPHVYPHTGWVEMDAEYIFERQYTAMLECIQKSGVHLHDIAGIGITNQRETTVLWDKKTGKPICNCIGWQCRRTADICEQLTKDGYAPLIEEKTGLRIDAYFSATKIMWMLENIKGAREKAEKGELLFGTMDSWLLWKLTHGEVHATDKTNASRTMIYNIEKDCWDDELLSIMNIPKCILPEVKSSSEIYGMCEIRGVKIPICGIAGDQQAALFGQGCFYKGSAKNTYGTGCFLLANIGKEFLHSKNGLVTTLGATLKGEKNDYVLEGSVFVGGAVIQWIRDQLGLIASASDSEEFATSVENNGGVYIVPAFTGLGAPYWNMHARGTITGLSFSTGKNYIIRASVESICYQTNDLLTSMSADMGAPIKTLKVDGGATANNFMMQFQSDISNISVLRPSMREATAQGVVFLAGLATGVYKDREEISKLLTEGKEFTPQMSEEERNKNLAGWQNAVKACQIVKE